MPTKDSIKSTKTTVQTLPLTQAIEKLNLPDVDRNLFSSLDWMTVLIKTYQLNLFVKYIEEDGKIVSYVIYSVVKNFLEWKICVCSFCDYSDAQVQSHEHWQLIFEDLKREYPKYRIAIRNLYDEKVREVQGLKELSREKHHLIELKDNVEATWQHTHRSFKVACKRATKEGVTVRRCGKEGLEQFYTLHLKLRKNKYRLFPQPYRFFETIWNQYMEQDKGVLLGTYDQNGRMVAANIYLVCGETLFYKFSTSAIDALKLRPNNPLMWEGIKYAHEKGLKAVDLGSSELYQDGLIWYKTHILKTTVESEIIHLGYAPEDYVFSNKIILKTYTKMLTMPWVPDSAVRIGCNFIYPFLA